MAKKVIFRGKGEIEFSLPSKRNTTTLKNGQSLEISDEKDIKVVKALRSLGLFLEEVKDGKVKAPVVETPVVEEAKVEEPTPVVEETPEVVEETVAEEKPVKYTFEELHAKRADELRTLAAELKVELKEGASKKEMSNAILEKLGE